MTDAPTRPTFAEREADRERRAREQAEYVKYANREQERTLVSTQELGGDPERTYAHPAYAMVSVSRYSGGDGVLFGSSVHHSQGAIRVRVTTAEETESDTFGTRYHGKSTPLIEFDLSEAQFVAMVTRMNHGEGVPCTLRGRRLDDGTWVPAPRIPRKLSPTEKLDEQVEASLKSNDEQMRRALDAMREELVAAKVPQKRIDAILGKLNTFTGNAASNRDFQRKRLVETKEKLVVESKVEIDAMLTAAVTNLGLASVQQLGALLAADPTALARLAHEPKEE